MTNKTSSEQPKMANSAPPKKANGKNRTISNISITTITITSRMKKSTSLIKKTTIMKSKTLTLSKTTRNKTSKMAKVTMKVIVCRKVLAQ